MRVALLQFKISHDKVGNLQNVTTLIQNVMREHNPRLVMLPEVFNSPFGSKYFRKYAEAIPGGQTSQHLSNLAKENAIFIVGGTIPELRDDKVYNTCSVWNPNGDLIAKHSKMHLFDIDVKGGMRFKESETISPGNEFTTFEVDGHKVGIGICYDIRFEEMARIYRNEGCEILLYPAAFNLTTGPAHWELLHRARALDNQVYVASASPARDETADYIAWGYTMIADPWGKVVKSAKESEEIIIADLDFEYLKQVREQIPIFQQRRSELYGTERKYKQ